MTETKWCPHCQAERPLTEFYVNRAAASGVDGYCKEYRKERQRERARQTRRNNRERREREENYVPPPRYRTDLLVDDGGRQCAQCERYQPWANYQIDVRSKTGHFSKCKTCVAERYREYAARPESKEMARRRSAEHRARKRGPDWVPSQVSRHAELDCDGTRHRCTGCLRVRLVTEFPRNPQTPCGYDPRCTQCRHERRVERRDENHNDIRIRELAFALARTGISVEEYEWLLREQGGGCALCGKPETQGDQYFAGKKRLSVDHDHAHCGPARACKRCIRGLLCHRCNVGLGMFEDNPRFAVAFADYLSRRPFM